MQSSRRAAAVWAAVPTGLASLGAAGAAFASSAAPPTHDTVQMLRLHTVTPLRNPGLLEVRRASGRPLGVGEAAP